MSKNQSNLSNPKYGYDLVVAVTQSSLNATMKSYLSGDTFLEVISCYVADPDGNPSRILYKDLLAKSKGSDPFKVPSDADPETNPDIKNLEDARFMCAFKAKIGLPTGLAPAEIPDIIKLNDGDVTFTLMCKEFILTQYIPQSGYSKPKWMNESQPDGSDPTEQPWYFTSNIKYKSLMINPDDYYKLPPDVYEQVKAQQATGNEFSVQQLFYDLSTAMINTIPKIKNVETGTPLSYCLTTYFMDEYFNKMRMAGTPVLSCNIVNNNTSIVQSPFVPTNIQFEKSPSSKSDSLSTLCYLCETDDTAPLPPVPFTWDWVDNSQDAHGVMGLNRTTFIEYLKSQLYFSAVNQCYSSSVRVSCDNFLCLGVTYSWSVSPQQTPTFNPGVGSNLFSYSYSSNSHDSAGATDDYQMTLNTSYNMDVTAEGNKLIVTQHLVVYTYIQVMHGTSAGGNIVDITITDTYIIDVDANGKLTTVKTTDTVNKSESPSANGFLDFFTGINDLINSVKKWIDEFIPSNIESIDVNAVTNCVFPGGNTFAFKDANFSEYQDLVANITYADPVQVHMVAFPELKQASMKGGKKS